jgi:hypothetical protein
MVDKSKKRWHSSRYTISIFYGSTSIFRLPLVSSLTTCRETHIVAKVGELMALSNRLQASLVAGDEIRSHLIEALPTPALFPTNQIIAVSQKVAAHG